MIPRILEAVLQTARNQFPIVGVVGPRQSGKTTLVRQVFKDYEYVNLEEPDNRRFATQDPRGFLNKYHDRVILDEAQRVPELFSYLQVLVDDNRQMGQFVLTGSQHFLMMESITQTLAGRIGLYTLYPLAYEELKAAGQGAESPFEQIWKGGYPRLYDQPVLPGSWLASYVQTYLDRDVNLLSQVGNLQTFETFLRLAAGRSGQLLNLASLAGDVGVSHNTIKSWIGLLQTSGVVFLLQPYFTNVSKRLIKTPKLYFVDTGLACQLLGIQTAQQLSLHPLYGSLFETFVVSEAFKAFYNRGLQPNLYFWRDQSGLEADLLRAKGQEINLYEIKSAQTVPTNVFGRLEEIGTVLKRSTKLNLIYGGSENQSRTMGEVVGWKNTIIA